MKRLLFNSVFFSIAVSIFYSCSVEEKSGDSPARTQYTLTVTAGEGGSVTPEATGTYDEGATITITATPDEGYVFDRWLGSDHDNSNCAFALHCRTAITIYSNRDVQAFFQTRPD